MHAVNTLLFLCLANWITANATTAAAARRAEQDAVADCQIPTSLTTNDGTTTTISNFPNSSCWDTLDMTDWMTKWNATTTVCTATTATKGVLTPPCQCLIDEPWATCFMRLTYQGNRTLGYECTDLMKPENCTQPEPDNVTPGPAEIFYGAYSIWSLFRYLTVWHASLTTATALPAITKQLSNAKIGALSANRLLAALIEDYSLDPSLDKALVSILTNEPIVGQGVAPARPTLANAQVLLGLLLQQVLDVVTSDWAGGDFSDMAEGGMLLNSSVETTKFLTARLQGL